jgi:ElaB/YqjD/DUF883 family membrane-anchored ribosome-binding protein
MNTSQSHIDNQDAYKSPEKLEQEVNQTRARIGERLETLSHRLSPGELLDQVLGMAREHGGEFSRNLGSQVKNNPVPLLITGIGMSWLMMASNNRNYDGRGQRRTYAPGYTDGYSTYPYTEGVYERSNNSDYESSMSNSSGYESSMNNSDYENSMSNDEGGPNVMDKAKEKIERVGDKVEHLKSSAREKMSRASETVHENVGSMRQNARHVQQNMRSTQECVTDFLREQPVLAASLGVALGAAIGALLPATEVEDRILGTASEETISKAQTVASNQYEKVRETAKEVADDVKQNLQANSDKRASATATSSANPATAPTNQVG